ncbi:hypothetical protein ACFVZ2_42745, partial [Streptomyces lasiicapitis]
MRSQGPTAPATEAREDTDPMSDSESDRASERAPDNPADTPPLTPPGVTGRHALWLGIGVVLLALNLRPALVAVSARADTHRGDHGG